LPSNLVSFIAEEELELLPAFGGNDCIIEIDKNSIGQFELVIRLLRGSRRGSL
jgi:hypothetical protein